MSRRTRSIRTRSMTGEDVRDSLHRSGLVFIPTTHHPAFALAVIQHLTTKRGVFAGDEFDQGMGKNFPDGTSWAHFVQLMELFDRHGVDMRHVKSFVGVLTCIVLYLRALLGVDGMVRYMLGIVEAICSNVEFEFDRGGEPVITYKITTDGTQKRDGWDADFDLYDLWATEVTQRAINPAKLQQYMQYIQMTGAAEPMRQVAHAAVQYVHGVERQLAQSYGSGSMRDGDAPELPDPAMFDLMSGRVMFGQINKAAPHLFATASVVPLHDVGGTTVYDVGAVRQWGDEQRRLSRSPVGGPARWPIEGGTVADLRKVVAEQQYNFIRPLPNGQKHVHTGLDLAAPMGAPLLSIYDGEVVSLRRDWSQADADAKRPGWERGNYLVVEYKGERDGSGGYKSSLPGGAYLRVSYYHLADVSDGLKVGDRVLQGQRIGSIGSTGNSSGPHLHLETVWYKPNSLGKPATLKALDPNLVLRDGAISAARSAGVDLSVGGVAPKPLLTLATASLHALAGGGFLAPSLGLPLLPDPVLAPEPSASGAPSSSAAAPAGGVMDDLMDIGKKAGDVLYGQILAPGSAGRAATQTLFSTVGIPPTLTSVVIEAMAAAHREIHARDGQAEPGDVIKAMAAAAVKQGASEGAAQAAATYLATAHGGVVIRSV